MENTIFKVFIEEKAQDYGRLYLEPLERGYGDTLGNALRRLLLSSIRGAAVVAVRIDGILHEFSTIPGVREDVIEILMNLKHIPIKVKAGTNNDNLNNETFKVITLDSDELQRDKDLFNRAENPGVITAKDLPWDSDFEFCGNGVLCTLEPGAHLVMEIYVAQGVGYLSAERERPAQPQLPIDALLTDAIFSPVKRVNYQIEPARVGQSIDFERLILEVWTNSAISPEEAVGQASRIAQTYFARVADTVTTAPHVPPAPTPEPPVVPVPRPDPDPFLTHNIHDLELSIRSENCLLRGGIKFVSDLLSRSHDDLLKVRNLGKKSLDEIEDKLRELGYSLAANSMSTSMQLESEEPVPAVELEVKPPKPAKPKTTKEAKPKKSSSKAKAKAEAPKAEEVKAEEAATVEAVVTAPVEEPVPAVEPEVKEKPKPAKSKTKEAKPKKSSSKAKAKAEAPKAEEVKAEEAATVEAVVTAPVEEPAPAVEPEVKEEPKPAKPKTKEAKPKKSSSKTKAKAEAPKAEEVKAEEAATVEAVVTAPVEETVPAVEPEVKEEKTKKTASKPRAKKAKTQTANETNKNE